jgi:hypothetical protein
MRRERWRLPAKEGKDQSEHDANNDAGDDGKIQSTVCTFDADVAGQASYPARINPAPEKKAKNDDDDTDHHEELPELRHTLISHKIPGERQGRASAPADRVANVEGAMTFT